MHDELRAVESEEDWATFHDIIVQVLWADRGVDISTYEPTLMATGDPAHHPFVLWSDRQAIGAFRLDIEGVTAWLRRVAIREAFQRRGHGRRMVELAAEMAREHGCSIFRSNVDRAAVEFYAKLGFVAVLSSGSDGGMLMEREI